MFPYNFQNLEDKMTESFVSAIVFKKVWEIGCCKEVESFFEMSKDL